MNDDRAGPVARLEARRRYDALEAALRRRITGEVRFDSGTRALYATDASNYRQVPIGVVAPRTTDDVVDTVRLCREHGAPILPRGGGTSLAGQCCNVAVILDMSRHLRGILHIDVRAKTARVQPGVVLDELQRALEPHGLIYGPDPATHAWCTFGGRPLYDFGLLESARDHLEAVFAALAASLDDRTRIVVLEPSCFAVFRDEAVNLFHDRSIAKALAERVVLFDAFVRPHFERRELPPLTGEALVHLHCHQTALVGRDETAAVLSASRLQGRMLDAGCCGMAGSFGFDRAHYKVSRDIGERVLLPTVRAAAPQTAIIADGFSCREQISHATGRRARHFAEIVWAQMQPPGRET